MGTSGALFPLMPLIMDMQPMKWLAKDWAKCESYYNTRTFGVFFQGTPFLRALWDGFLLPDVCERTLGPSGTTRLLVNVTQIAGSIAAPQLVSAFESRESLIEVASDWLPTYFDRFSVSLTGDACCDWYPRSKLNTPPLIGHYPSMQVTLFDSWLAVKGQRLCDGAFTLPAPQVSPNTVLLSPWRSFQPAGYKYVISPSKRKISAGGNRGKRSYGSFSGSFVASTVCFTAPTANECINQARHGYEDARAAHDMLVDAGWIAKPKQLVNKYQWNVEGKAM